MVSKHLVRVKLPPEKDHIKVTFQAPVVFMFNSELEFKCNRRGSTTFTYNAENDIVHISLANHRIC